MLDIVLRDNLLDDVLLDSLVSEPLVRRTRLDLEGLAHHLGVGHSAVLIHEVVVLEYDALSDTSFLHKVGVVVKEACQPIVEFLLRADVVEVAHPTQRDDAEPISVEQLTVILVGKVFVLEGIEYIEDVELIPSLGDVILDGVRDKPLSVQNHRGVILEEPLELGIGLDVLVESRIVPLLGEFVVTGACTDLAVLQPYGPVGAVEFGEDVEHTLGEYALYFLGGQMLDMHILTKFRHKHTSDSEYLTV